MFTQHSLRSQVARRIHRARAGLGAAAAAPGPDRTTGPPELPELPDPPELKDPPDLAELRAAVDDAPPTCVVAVLRRFDAAVFVQASLDFAAGLPAGPGDAWFRAYTRTVFLAGNPENLRSRFRFQHLSEDRSVAWSAPASEGEQGPLLRLLRRFPAAGPPGLPAALSARVPGGPAARPERPERPERSARPARLYVATAGLSAPDYLIHVNHLLSEATLTGLLAPGDEVTVLHVPRLDGTAARYAMLRIAPDPACPQLLHPYAGLVTATRAPR